MTTDYGWNVDAWNGQGSLPLLYAKTATGAVNVWQCWVQSDRVCVRWGQEGGAAQESSFACTPKNVGRANATTAEQQAVLEAIAKWKKQVKKKYHWDRAHVLTALNLKPMLAKAYKDRLEMGKVTWPATAQPKYDGVRCLAYMSGGRVVLQSRGGDPYYMQHIIDELTPRWPHDQLVLDGELYVHDISLQQLNSLVRRPQEDSRFVGYHVYDLTWKDHNADWLTRRAQRAQWFQMHNAALKHVFEVLEHTVTTHDDVKRAHDNYVAMGYEGAIIRLREGSYRFGHRSSELLKLKDFQDDEFEIIGWARGKGKFENVPTFKCKTADGKEFDCTPKGSDAERSRMLEVADSLVGKHLKVRYFDYTDDGVPHYPVGLAIREDWDR